MLYSWFQIICFEALTSIYLTTGWGKPPLTILVRDLNLHLLPLPGSCHAQAIPKAKAPRHGRATDMWMLDGFYWPGLPRFTHVFLLDLALLFLVIYHPAWRILSLIYKLWKQDTYIYIYIFIFFKTKYIIYIYIYFFLLHIFSSAPSNKIPIKGVSFTKNPDFMGLSCRPRRGIMAFCGLVVALLLDWAQEPPSAPSQQI